jgi:hypothetical protein
MTGNEVYPIYRKVQLPTAVLIVHRRVGRSRIRSLYDIRWGSKGRWGTVCRSNFSYNVNVTTKWEEVTCLRCLKKGEIYGEYSRR